MKQICIAAMNDRYKSEFICCSCRPIYNQCKEDIVKLGTSEHTYLRDGVTTEESGSSLVLVSNEWSHSPLKLERLQQSSSGQSHFK